MTCCRASLEALDTRTLMALLIFLAVAWSMPSTMRPIRRTVPPEAAWGSSQETVVPSPSLSTTFSSDESFLGATIETLPTPETSES